MSRSKSSRKQVVPVVAPPLEVKAPDPEVIPGNSEYGNRYSLEFKRKVLRESDLCTKPGDIGLYLRQQGITHATLTCFRKQRSCLSLGAKSGTNSIIKSKSSESPARVNQVMKLEQENRLLRRRLERAEAMVELQKKVAHLLELVQNDPISGTLR